MSSSSDSKNFPIGVCVKVDELRPKYKNLKEWCNTPGNILITRHGRVCIVEDGKKQVFIYPASEWQNSFRVDDYGLDECLKLYEQHLSEYLKDKKRLDRFKLLLNAKEIGCFCRSGAKCHRDIVLKFLNMYR